MHIDDVAPKRTHDFGDLTRAALSLVGAVIVMVFAVYMPPQAPAPGIAHCSISDSSLSETWPRACWPTASNTDTMSTFRPRYFPGMIVPP